MKSFPSVFFRFRSFIIVAVVAIACLPSLATTFTNDTTIGAANTNYDGTDIIVSNCTVAVDGTHAFSSMRVASGGVLTHSFFPSGLFSNIFFVTNEVQVLSSTNPSTLLNSNITTTSVVVTDTNGTNIYMVGTDFTLVTISNFTQLQLTTNSAIAEGATVLASYQVLLNTFPAGLSLSIAGSLQLDVGGTINADGKGFGGNNGSGAGHSAGSPLDGSGGGYGGNGGTSSSNAVGGSTYGSFAQPTSLGSGGGSGYAGVGGAGGGLIQITAGGSVIVNGTISANGANGTNSRSGGGSGGSIWITGISSLSGSGSMTANGGAGEPTHGGGGGGGRISLQYNSTSFAGSTSAYGGIGSRIGGAGTVYRRITNQNGSLVLDNAGQSGMNTTVGILDPTISVLIQSNATAVPSGSWSIGNLTIASNAFLVANSQSTLSLTVASSLTVRAGGGILADGTGSGPGVGIGTGHGYNDNSNRPCTGGGYGGNGGGFLYPYVGGIAYGIQTSPTGFGSGGGSLLPYSIGGGGGGGIQITTQNGLLQIDGTLSANGLNGAGSGGGGGSGGTISITGGTLSGFGSVTAAGGNGTPFGGGGGGGRIYINAAANLFAGNISAYGGGGMARGGAGTVFLQIAGQNSQLILDNGGHAGTNTPVTSANTSDLIVRGGAIGSAAQSVTFANLNISSNSWLAPIYTESPSFSSINFTITGNATVQAGGGVVADRAGSGPGQGTGFGHLFTLSSTNLGSGAGHGGYGGNSYGNYALGGNTFDSPTSPTSAGSGGGNSVPLSPGGFGGGIIRLTVTGTLQLEGLISANAGNGSGQAGGGGAGGSIWLAVGTLAGGGSITANGGNGANLLGGGGGGGMIYIPCNNNSFSGIITAYGGTGANRGGVGTSVIQLTGKNAQVVVDGGGNSGAATTLPGGSSMDVTLRNGAVGLANSTLTLGNLIISSNAALLVSNSPGSFSSLNFVSATVQAGGVISGDSQGYAAGSGSGAGHISSLSPNYPGSGAGHGGIGGDSLTNTATGGPAYDNQASPSIAGSGGGGYTPYSVGGNGGSAFSITVSGLLQIDGIISANGGNGTGIGGGGGAGGSIRLSAATLSGSGTIRANGGAGANSIGGGGAGGCITILPTANLFTGAILANGGSGANWGGAGTVYLQPIGQQTSQLIIDNGGQTGAATPIGSVSSTTALILRNGAIAYQPSSQTFASLVIGSNSFLTVSTQNTTVNLTLTGNATIQAGGGIITDNKGSAPNSGTGAGHSTGSSPNYPCTGAGYGGYGGGVNASGTSGNGGTTYASVISPTTVGSGGGSITPYSPGGSGGGSIRLNVTGTLVASGIISANGGNGSGGGGGGGSGGSIWLTAGTLAGSGAITANGGNGVDSVGGGGGGGRISIGYNANSFVGTISAHGGTGYLSGGAGTIYTKANSQSVGQVLVDNSGVIGTNTPLYSSLSLPPIPFNLVIQNGAIVCPQPGQSSITFPQLSSLTIASGGVLTGLPGPSTLDVLVFNNATVASGGAISADGVGYLQAVGPGKGLSSSGSGSGAGYGGVGGASVAAPGGTNYGSALQPVDFGSGGGVGTGVLIGGSGGGGAVRLNVGGIFTLDGQLTAEGQPGFQDNSGGGSGGSIWVNAGTLAGAGLVAADGGEGELFGGGGGAGGRIAVYSRTSAFFGFASAFGAVGDFNGADGSIVFSNGVPTLQVLSNSVSGIVSNGVSSLVLYFNNAPNPSSISASAMALATPNGPLASGSLTVSMLTAESYRVSFPLQTAVGDYTATAGPNIIDLYGRPMSQAYSNTFTISLPVISGTITDTNGSPVAGVVLQPSIAMSSAITDTNGNYTLGFVPGSTFTVTPALTNFVFTPDSISYTNASASVSNQNYTAVLTPVAPLLIASGNSTNFSLGWQAVPRLNYQIYCSSNLVDWVPYGSPIIGSNGPTQISLPVGANPFQFYSLRAGN